MVGRVRVPASVDPDQDGGWGGWGTGGGQQRDVVGRNPKRACLCSPGLSWKVAKTRDIWCVAEQRVSSCVLRTLDTTASQCPTPTCLLRWFIAPFVRNRQRKASSVPVPDRGPHMPVGIHGCRSLLVGATKASINVRLEVVFSCPGRGGWPVQLPGRYRSKPRSHTPERHSVHFNRCLETGVVVVQPEPPEHRPNVNLFFASFSFFSPDHCDVTMLVLPCLR